MRIGLYLAFLATMVGVGAYGWATTPPGEVGPGHGVNPDRPRSTNLGTWAIESP